MSLNWVMLAEDRQSFTPLPSEQRLYISPPRTSLAISSVEGSGAPNRTPQFSLDSNDGTVFLTNRRIIYLPSRPTAALESFAAPILNCADAHVAAPFFGPNVWTATVVPVAGGNIPAHCAAVGVRMTFKDGGAYDFHSTFERVKERTVQAVEMARESGHFGAAAAGGGASAAAAGLDAVHLDELPAYEHATATAQVPLLVDVDDHRALAASAGAAAPAAVVPPAEPPTYEDVQLETVTNEMESRMRLGG